MSHVHVRRRAVLAPVLLCGVLVAGILAAPPPLRAQVLIHEVLADPASDWDGDGTVAAIGDEWVELINLGSEPVDLTNYWLLDGLGDDPHMRLSGVLAPGAVLVVYGSDALRWQAETSNGVSGLSLNNTGDTVHLVVGPQTDQLVIIDTVSYLGHEAVDDRSSGRLLSNGAWVLFDGLNPYGGTTEPLGSGCPPTPGEPNLCQSDVPVNRTTWTELKTLFEG
ncbi:MAG: lamin tail domain-containing protein [Candidatus Krumholzibacteriia bacterium]